MEIEQENPTPSHACKQVATGRGNPDPPMLVMSNTLELAGPAILNPALTLRAPMGFASRIECGSRIRATRVSKWRLDVGTRIPRCWLRSMRWNEQVQRPSTRRSRLGLRWSSLRETDALRESEPRVGASGDWTWEPVSPEAGYDRCVGTSNSSAPQPGAHA